MCTLHAADQSRALHAAVSRVAVTRPAQSMGSAKWISTISRTLSQSRAKRLLITGNIAIVSLVKN